MTKTILVVDDELDIRQSVKMILEKNGYTVLTAENGDDCLIKIKDTTPDLILLDIMMPEMDGWDVFTKLKENPYWAKVSIVFLTAKTDTYSKGFGNLLANDFVLVEDDKSASTTTTSLYFFPISTKVSPYASLVDLNFKLFLFNLIVIEKSSTF